jgi:hypothetical protein
MDSEISKKNKRFEKINNDPKFKPIPKKVHKVELNDNRFNAMFHNKDFYSTSKVDKYGRKLEKREDNKNIMDEYYIRKDKQKPKKKEKEDIDNKPKEEEEESDTSEEFQEFLDNMNKNMEEMPQEENEEKIPHGEATSRIAIQNLDWANIHALDLYILLNSFCKGSQKVLKVEIYPSEYGMKEMAKENTQGPDKEIFNTEAIVKTGKNDEEEEEEEENDDEEIDSNEGFDPVELRKYELKKLKYYYAVAYCDSIETANSLYEECDGLEIERTQSFMDMRFVPDEIKEFPYKPKEVCDHMPANKEYNQEFRPNSALQDTRVKLTWDQGDPRRQDLLSRAFHKEGFNEDDINELLVSSDSEVDSDVINGLVGEEEEEEDKNIQLNLLKKKRKMPKFKDGETIEIKFNKGFEGINTKVLNENEDKKENKSKWEQFKEQKKNKRKEKKREEREKKKKRKEQRDKNYEEESEEDYDKNKNADKNELNLLVDEQIKNKKKFKYNDKDERFQTNNNTDFAIDPTNKNYKKIKDKKIL